MLKWVLALGMVAAIPAAAMAQDADAGKKVFNKCKACHDHATDKNKVGPTLKGVVGRAAGTVEGFNYSAAMKDSGITWDEANLTEYLHDPKKKVPGNKMVFPGLKDDADIADLIAFLKTSE